MVKINEILNNPFQINESYLKLGDYRTPQQQGDETGDKTGKGKNEYNRFDHLEKYEVVDVINRVLKDSKITKVGYPVGKGDAFFIENAIRENYQKWNGNRENAITWLKQHWENTVNNNKGF